MVEGGGPVEHPQKECGGHEESEDLEPESPAEPPEAVVEELAGEDDPGPVTGDQDDLHDLPLPLEVLTHHERGAVPAHADSNTLNDPDTDEQLVELGGEGGEETGQGWDRN